MCYAMWNWYTNNNPVRKLKNKVEEQKMKTKNKSFKRLFAFLVALVMVTALVPSVIFAADPTFPDVPTTHWAYVTLTEPSVLKTMSPDSRLRR